MITEILATALQEAGIAIDGKQLEMMDRYACHLAETNRVMNLTAITDPEGIALKHFFDCILVLQKLDPPKGARVIDVGTGAGFPGIPFAIMRPDLSITLLDATKKKLRFIEEGIEMLGLSQVTTHHARAEDAGHDGALREQFDLAVARAVAATDVLVELMLPFLAVGGTLAALKGPSLEEELAHARPLIGTLGGEEPHSEVFTLPGGEGRTLLTIRKGKATPARYPRAPGKTGR